MFGSVTSCQNEGAPKAEPVPKATSTPATVQKPQEDAIPVNSLMTPFLNREMKEGQNMLWIATFPMAWAELHELAGGPVKIDSSPTLVEGLNSEAVTGSELLLDPESYVAVAGFVGDELFQHIRNTATEPLAAQALADLEALPRDSLAIYAYLEKHLPFQWAFERFDQPLTFGGEDVAAFGLKQYLANRPDEQKLAEQIVILDYQSDENFILELLTASSADRLLLAKIPAAATFKATVNQVLKRIEQGTASGLANLESVVIPVIELDQLEQYQELCGRNIQAENSLVNGKSFSLVAQRIRFTLDETGASLESKTMAFSARSPRQFIFDKPFLVLLLRKDAQLPYFALWVENATVLTPLQ